MIRVFLLLLSALAATWFIADTIKQKGPGYAYIYIDQYSIETSFWFLLAALLVITLLLYVVIRSISYALSLGLKTAHFSLRFGLTKSRKMHQIAVLAYLEGFWHKTQTDMQKALKKLETPFIANLFIFHARLKQGDTNAAELALQQAQTCEDYDELSVMLAHIDLWVAKDQPKEAIASIKSLLNEYPFESRVLSKAIHCYLSFDEVEAVEPFIKQAKKQHLLTDAQIQQWQLDFYHKKVQTAADWKSLKKLWRNVHKLDNDKLFHSFFSQALDKADASELEKMLRQVLKKKWHEELLGLYADIDIRDSKIQFEVLKKYTEEHKNSANLFFALALLEKKAQHVDQALSYINQSIAIRPSINAFKLQAEVYAIQGNTERQLFSLEQALSLV